MAENNIATTNTTSDNKVIVHHLNDSRSQRILWLLEELGVPYEIKRYERTAEHRAPKELFAVHPLGKSPVITDGSLTLAESGAIVEYLIEKYGKPVQLSDAGKLDNLYFTHYAEGSLMPPLVLKLVFSLIPGQTPFFIRPLVRIIFNQVDAQYVDPQLKKHGAHIEEHISKLNGGWIAGGNEPTSADYLMGFALEAMTSQDNTKRFVGPKTVEYVKMIHERPAYKRGLEKGGAYAFARL